MGGPRPSSISNSTARPPTRSPASPTTRTPFSAPSSEPSAEECSHFVLNGNAVAPHLCDGNSRDRRSGLVRRRDAKGGPHPPVFCKRIPGQRGGPHKISGGSNGNFHLPEQQGGRCVATSLQRSTFWYSRQRRTNM